VLPEKIWTVAIIDSGSDWGAPLLKSARRFVDHGSEVESTSPQRDTRGHGTRVAAIVAGGAARLALISAQVLNAQGRATAAAVAAGIHWSLGEGAQLIHLSIGLHQDRPVLREAVTAALSAGVLVVAATPARGESSYPARYPGVLRATGDARCGPEEIAWLGGTRGGPEVGACVAHAHAAHRVSRGASIGAAYASRFILARLEPGLPLDTVRARLARASSYQGAERREVRSAGIS